MLGEAGRGGVRLVAWASPSTSTARTTSGRSSTSALARGFVGREGCGLMPIRGHSGVQGGAEMGCYATALPGGRADRRGERGPLSALWGFEVPATPGHDRARDDRRRRRRRARRALLGRRQLPRDPARPGVRAGGAGAACRCASTRTSCCRARCWSSRPTRCSLLPAATRYEIPGRRHRDHDRAARRLQPGGPGPADRPRRAPSGRCFVRAGAPGSARAGRAASLRRHRRDPRARSPASVPALRRDRAPARGRRPVPVRRPPAVRGLEFPTADGKAHFSLVVPTPPSRRRALRRLDPPRQAVQQHGAGEQGLDHRRGARGGPGQPRRRAATRPRRRRRRWCAPRRRVLRGRATIGPITPGNLQVHWPEGHVLIDATALAEAGIPDFNTRASVEPAGAARVPSST